MSGKSEDYAWDKAKKTLPLTTEQQEILEKRGVLSPDQIHKLASKVKQEMTDKEQDKASCHSDYVEPEEAQQMQTSKALPVLNQKP